MCKIHKTVSNQTHDRIIAYLQVKLSLDNPLLFVQVPRSDWLSDQLPRPRGTAVHRNGCVLWHLGITRGGGSEKLACSSSNGLKVVYGRD